VLTEQSCLNIALIAGLAGGAIAGIVIAAVIGGLLVSGGAGALTTLDLATEENVLNTNPIYQDKGLHGTNAFHEANL